MKKLYKRKKFNNFGRLMVVAIIITAGAAAAVIFLFGVRQDFAQETELSAVVFNPALEEPKKLITKLPENKDVAVLKNLSQRAENNKSAKDPLELKRVLLEVPFTPQAPLGEWSDPRQDYACEEASWLMVWHYINNQPLSRAEAKKQIIALADWELNNYGDFHDSSAQDTVIRFKQYFNYQPARLVYNITIDDIKQELLLGNPVIVPVNGRLLDNPYYTPPGPLQHMMVVVGFDDKTQEVITNDPGTRRGENLRYGYEKFIKALRDYETGHDEPITENRTAMIVIEQLEAKN